MITRLYRRIFELTMKKRLSKNFEMFCAGRGFSSDQEAQINELNTRFYSSKMQVELDLALAEIKSQMPWIDKLSWSYAACVCLCILTILCFELTGLARVFVLACGGVGFCIVIFLLCKTMGVLNGTIDAGRAQSPAASIAFQIPLTLLQILLSLSLLIVGAFTHNISMLISGISIIMVGALTQYTSMGHFLTAFESRLVSYKETNEFLKATPGLYTYAAKAWLLSESMDGSILNIGTLQHLQDFEVKADGDAIPIQAES